MSVGEHELFINAFEITEDVTLTGYITATVEDEMYVSQGTIFFMPENAADLVFTLSFKNSSPRFAFMGDVIFYTDGVILRAGTVYDEDNADLDLSLIPTDGTANRVTFTFTDITITTSEWLSKYMFSTARIVDIAQA